MTFTVVGVGKVTMVDKNSLQLAVSSSAGRGHKIFLLGGYESLAPSKPKYRVTNNLIPDVLSDALQLYQKNLPAEVSKQVCGSLVLEPLRNSLFTRNFIIHTVNYEIYANMHLVRKIISTLNYHFESLW